MGRRGPAERSTSQWHTLDHRQKHVLMCTLSVNALLFFDQTSVAVALPTLQRHFHTSATELRWTITAYLLALATLMVVAGRLADRFGRRRMLLAGIALFGVASAACALAPNPAVLIGARFVQGIGGAIMQPLALAHTARAVGDQRRGWAVGVLSTGGTTFLAVGPLVAGAVVDLTSWRWLFVLNLPGVAFAWYQGHRWITPSRESSPRRVEPLGLFLLITGLGTGVTGISQLSTWHGPAQVLLGTGILLLGLFAWHELRASAPLIPLAVLGHDRAMLASLVALLAIQFAVLANSVYLVLFLQHGLGERALTAGAVLALAGIFTPLLSIRTGQFTDRYGPRKLIVGGLFLATAGLGWLAVVAPRYELLLLVPGLLMFGLARPAVFTPASAGAFVGMDPQRRGLASGLVTEARQLGGLLGVAVPGAVLAALHGPDLVASSSLGEGFRTTMLVAAAVTALAAVTVRAVLAGWRPGAGSTPGSD